MRNLSEYDLYQNTLEGFDGLISFDEYEAIRDCNYEFLEDKLNEYSTVKEILKFIHFNDLEVNFNRLWNLLIRKHPNIIINDSEFIRKLTFWFNDVDILKILMQGITCDLSKTIFLNKETVRAAQDYFPEIECYYGNLILASSGDVRKTICDFVKKHWRGQYRWFAKDIFDDDVLAIM